jgi:hypothetical protein
VTSPAKVVFESAYFDPQARIERNAFTGLEVYEDYPGRIPLTSTMDDVVAASVPPAGQFESGGSATATESASIMGSVAGQEFLGLTSHSTASASVQNRGRGLDVTATGRVTCTFTVLKPVNYALTGSVSISISPLQSNGYEDGTNAYVRLYNIDTAVVVLSDEHVEVWNPPLRSVSFNETGTLAPGRYQLYAINYVDFYLGNQGVTRNDGATYDFTLTLMP